MLDQGGLNADTESIVWVYNTRDGFHVTAAEAWGARNFTSSSEDDAAGVITLHVHLRSISNVRLVFFTLFVATAAWGASFHPTECMILRNSASRSVVGRAEDEPPEDPVPQGAQAELNYSMDAYLEEQEEAECGPELLRNELLQQAYENFAVDDESQATINRLSDDDEVLVFMPAEEIIIADGPKRSILYFLLDGNHRVAQRINDFAEAHKVWGQIPAFPALIIGTVALTEWIPLHLTWCAALTFPDIARCIFKLNVQAVRRCIGEPFDFQVPFVSLVLALYGAMASFEFHGGCCTIFISWGLIIVTHFFLGEFNHSWCHVQTQHETLIVKFYVNPPLYTMPCRGRRHHGTSNRSYK